MLSYAIIKFSMLSLLSNIDLELASTVSTVNNESSTIFITLDLSGNTLLIQKRNCFLLDFHVILSE